MKKLMTTTSIATLLMAAPVFAGNNAEEVGTNLEQAADAAGDAVTETAKDAGEAIENTAKDVENAAAATAEDAETAVENTAEDISTATENTAQDIENAAESSAAALEETAEAATDNVVSGPEMTIEGYSQVAPDMIPAEDLTGVRVYDATEDWIGEIENLILADDGKINSAVIGVGGFLGIGEKDVLIDFSQVSLMQETDGDNLRAFVDETEETLKAKPEYEAAS